MVINQVLCAYCGNPIINPKINQIYHKSCFIIHRRIYKRNKEMKYYSKRTKFNKEKKCKFCGKSFQSVHGNQKYCSKICKNDYKSKLKGFKSQEEELAFKNKSCPECFSDLTYNHYDDFFECVLCDYKRRPLTPVSRDSYTRIKLLKIDTDIPFDYNFQKIRGSPQIQNISITKNKISPTTDVVLPKDLYCDDCRMLKNNCICRKYCPENTKKSYNEGHKVND